MFNLYKKSKLLKVHQQPVTSVVFSYNKSFISGSTDRSLALIDAEAMQIVGSFNQNYPVNCLASNLSIPIFATGSNDHKVRIWDAKTGNLTQVLSLSKKVLALSFSLDGKFLACASGSELFIWRIADWKLLYRTQAAFTGSRPDGWTSLPINITRVGFVDDAIFYLDEQGGSWVFFDIDWILAGKGVSGIFTKSFSMVPNYVVDAKKGLEFTNLNGISSGTTIQRLYSGNTKDPKHPLGGVMVYNNHFQGPLTITGLGNELGYYIGENNSIVNIAFRPNGGVIRAATLDSENLLAIATENGDITFWHLDKGIQVQRIPNPNMVVNSLVLSPNSQFLVLGFNDGNIGFISQA